MNISHKRYLIVFLKFEFLMSATNVQLLYSDNCIFLCASLFQALFLSSCVLLCTVAFYITFFFLKNRESTRILRIIMYVYKSHLIYEIRSLACVLVFVERLLITEIKDM